MSSLSLSHIDVSLERVEQTGLGQGGEELLVLCQRGQQAEVKL